MQGLEDRRTENSFRGQILYRNLDLLKNGVNVILAECCQYVSIRRVRVCHRK